MRFSSLFLPVVALSLLASVGAAAQRAPVPAAPAKPAADSTLTVTGTVFDSVAGVPLAGATIQMMSMRDNDHLWVGTSAADGSWRITGVPRGDYVTAFVHPTLEVLGIESPNVGVRLPATGPAPAVALSTPGPARLFSALCPNTRDSSGALVGRVRDADADLGLPAKVVVTWTEIVVGAGGVKRLRQRVPATTRPDGSYLVCGLPSDADLQLGAEAPAHVGGLLELNVTRGAVTRRDIALADSTGAVSVEPTPGATERVMRGTARVAGAVRSKNGVPVPGARVSVEGTGLSATAADDGTFSLTGLPAGSWSLVARAVGFEPRAVPIDLASRRTTSASVVLDKRVQTLASVNVYGKKTRAARDLDEFLDRKSRGGFGHFVTAEDIEKRNPINVTDLLTTMPGMQVHPNGSTGYAIRGRGGCTPQVVIDGMAVSGAADELDNFVRPNQVAGIEVYNGDAGAPIEYGMPNGCGSVLVWTKR